MARLWDTYKQKETTKQRSAKFNECVALGAKSSHRETGKNGSCAGKGHHYGTGGDDREQGSDTGTHQQTGSVQKSLA
jgi:hypothetical protein